MLRAYAVILVPIYIGPYWAAFNKGTGSFAFVAFLSIAMSVALSGVVAVALALEDPFDNQVSTQTLPVCSTLEVQCVWHDASYAHC